MKTELKNEFLDRNQKSVAYLFSKYFLNEEATHELTRTAEMENKLDRNDLIYETSNKKKNKTYDFQNFKTIRFFGEEIDNNGLSLDDTLGEQIRLNDDIDVFKESAKSKKKKKQLLLKMQSYFLMEGKEFLMLLKVECFQK